MKTLAVVLGTRPEIIKLAPLVLRLRAENRFAVKVIASGQHSTMAEQAFRAFGLVPDIDLGLMRPDQTLNSFLGLFLPELEKIYTQLSPAGVIVQGDTTTALGGALAAFHRRIPVAHVEAGLRTGDLASPFPEEMNRVAIGALATIHLCHTEHAKRNLLAEGKFANLHVTGNTVVDALKYVSKKLDAGELKPEAAAKEAAAGAKRLILITGHRRENFDGPLKNLCRTLAKAAKSFPDVTLVYPVHLNPNVQKVAQAELANLDRVRLIEPVDYPSFVWLMRASTLIVSDSGGVQEEAPTLGKRVIVTRNTTERPEAVEAGFSEVVSLANPDELYARIEAHLTGNAGPLPQSGNPYGDGGACSKIVEIFNSTL